MNKLEIGNIVRVNKKSSCLFYELAEINNDEAKLFFIGLGQIDYTRPSIEKLENLIKAQKHSRDTRFDKDLKELIIERNYKNQEVK